MIFKSVLPAKGAGAFVLLLTFAFLSNRAIAACSLVPERNTNVVGAVHGVTARVTTNGIPVNGLAVSFAVVSGPNANISGSSTTGTNGNALFNYTGAGGTGTDIIRATGTVSGVAFSCLATQIWVMPPTISCPPGIVTNTSAGDCSQSVTFSVTSSGSPMPARRCMIGDTVITSPHTFSAGVTIVNCVASNVNGTASCSFTVTVTESQPPEITCPPDVFVTALPGEGSAVVDFSDPEATDACGDVTVACEPTSGSVFPIGTSTVTCTATDSSGNTNICAFAVTVEEVAPETHDLAIVRIVAPKIVTLSALRPTVTKRIVVTIQNRSPHTEAFFDPAQLRDLVTLNVLSLDTNVCFDITAFPLERPPQRRLPFNLRSKQKMNVYFDVTFDCAVNSAKGAGQGDFYYVATVNHAAIDPTLVDTHPECDVCPRPPLEGGVDPNPNGRIRDKGCGAPRGDGTFGNDIITDVFVR
jgi:hypothetical protein